MFSSLSTIRRQQYDPHVELSMLKQIVDTITLLPTHVTFIPVRYSMGLTVFIPLPLELETLLTHPTHIQLPRPPVEMYLLMCDQMTVHGERLITLITLVSPLLWPEMHHTMVDQVGCAGERL